MAAPPSTNASLPNGGCDKLTTCYEHARLARAVVLAPAGYLGQRRERVSRHQRVPQQPTAAPLRLSSCAPTHQAASNVGTCPSGYTGFGNTTNGCVDINECATNNGGCDALTTCTNIAGSFFCGACPSGYSGTGASGCTDVNECATNNGGCDALATCTNTPGSFTCGACPSGYSGSGASGCTDVNECATNNGGCDALATCTNTPGSFTCGACPSGYSGSAPRDARTSTSARPTTAAATRSPPARTRPAASSAVTARAATTAPARRAVRTSTSA